MMCEECKCTIGLDRGCDNGCGCCNENLAELLSKRESQILAITEDDRDEYLDENPIFHAEQGPNRFALMSMFFTDTDGVQIQEDLDLGEITVKYFTDSNEVVLTEGALYEWAVKHYQENY